MSNKTTDLLFKVESAEPRSRAAKRRFLAVCVKEILGFYPEMVMQITDEWDSGFRGRVSVPRPAGARRKIRFTVKSRPSNWMSRDEWVDLEKELVLLRELPKSAATQATYANRAGITRQREIRRQSEEYNRFPVTVTKMR